MALNGKQKALIFLSTLGDEVSRKVLNCLPEKQAKIIVQELNAFPEPAPEAIALVLKELSKVTITSSQANAKLPSPEEKQEEAQKKELAEKVRRTAKELLVLLEREKLQTIAFVLQNCEEAIKMEYYDLLSPGKRNELKRLSIEEVPLSAKVSEAIQPLLVKVFS